MGVPAFFVVPMPYKLSENGLCVVRADTGEKMKCYSTHAEAAAYLGALEANVPEAKMMNSSQLRCPQCSEVVKPQQVNGSPSCPKCGADIPQAMVDAMKAGDNAAMWGAVKAAGDWTLDVLGVPYGGPHKGKDTHGEYFTPQTNLHDGKYPIDVYYYHGFTPDGYPQGEPENIAKVVARTRKSDGMWYRTVLDRGSQYSKRVWDAALKDMARASTGTIAHLKRVLKSGEIINWPVVELSLFDTEGKRQPANQYAVALPVLKARGIDLTVFGEDSGGGIGAEQPGAAVISDENEETDMDDSKLEAMIAKTVAEALAKQPKPDPVIVVQEAPATKTEEQPKSDEEKWQARMDNAVKQALDQQKQRQKELDDYAAAAVKREHQRFAQEGRLRTFDVDGAPRVLSMKSKYDNLEPRDLALLLDILTPPLTVTDPDKKDYSRAPQGAVKALALKLESSEAQQGTSDVDLPAVKSTLKVDNRDLYADAIKMMREQGIKANELDHTTQTGFGAEFVGIAYSTNLWYVIRQDPGVGARMMAGAIEIPQGMASIYLPLEAADMTWYMVAETTANNATTGIPDSSVLASKLATDRKQLVPKKMGARTVWSGEMDEDSLIPWISNLRRQLELSAMEQFTSVVIDGDTVTTSANINNINGSALTTNAFLLFNGFRKSPLVTTTALSRSAGGSLAAEDFLATAKLLGPAGINAIDTQKVSFIIDPNVMFKALTLPEFKTRDVNSLATIEQGKLAYVYGYNVITSAFMHYPSAKRMALNTGKIDVTDANNTTGAILAVRWDQWQLGFKRRVTIETQRIPAADATQIVAMLRVGMVQRDTNASAETYNVGVA